MLGGTGRKETGQKACDSGVFQLCSRGQGDLEGGFPCWEVATYITDMIMCPVTCKYHQVSSNGLLSNFSMSSRLKQNHDSLALVFVHFDNISYETLWQWTKQLRRYGNAVRRQSYTNKRLFNLYRSSLLYCSLPSLEVKQI